MGPPLQLFRLRAAWRFRVGRCNQYPRLAPPPPDRPPPKLEPPPDDRPPDDELGWIRGRVFVYSCRKLQKAQVSMTRALPLLLVVACWITVSLDDLVRLRHCAHFAYPVIHFG